MAASKYVMGVPPIGLGPYIREELRKIELSIESVLSVPPNWSYPPLLNGWLDYDAANWMTARYYKSPLGIVYIQGLIKSGPLPSIAFVLPTGYRPGNNVLLSTISANGGTEMLSRLDIRANGDVVPISGGNTYFSICNISFPADQ